MRVSFLELYNEELFDLLSTSDHSTTKLRIFEDATRKVFTECVTCKITGGAYDRDMQLFYLCTKYCSPLPPFCGGLTH